MLVCVMSVVMGVDVCDRCWGGWQVLGWVLMWVAGVEVGIDACDKRCDGCCRI